MYFLNQGALKPDQWDVKRENGKEPSLIQMH